MRKAGSKIPTIIGVFLLIIGVGVGVLLVNREQVFHLEASPVLTPKDVRVTNIENDSFTVSWVTDKSASGFIKWGDTNKLGQTHEESSANSNSHLLTLTGLTGGKTYYFKINSGGQDFDNNGTPWTGTTVTTKSTISGTRISGTAQLSTGGNAGGVLVYVSGNGIAEKSTITSSNGNWTMNVPAAATDTQALLNIYVQGGAAGISTAQVYVSKANPIPPMTLGQTYDFRNTSTNINTDNSTPAVINLPVTSTSSGQSKLDSSTKTATQTATSTVTIKNVTEGETIFTNKPQFMGNGPKSTNITITVHSNENITQTVKVAADGSWQWTPPKNLSEGSHTITISWKDSTGILRTITRQFVVTVNAAEPAFESTPSGNTPTPTATVKPTTTPTVTPTATPIASGTPVATKSPTPIPTVKATATPRPTIEASTESTLPDAGDETDTLYLLAFGALLLIGGIFIGIKSLE